MYTCVCMYTTFDSIYYFVKMHQMQIKLKYSITDPWFDGLSFAIINFNLLIAVRNGWPMFYDFCYTVCSAICLFRFYTTFW